MTDKSPSLQETPAANTAAAAAAKASAASFWRSAAWIAGVFCVLTGVLLAQSYWRARTDDPFRSPLLKKFKEDLRANPVDEALKQRIRQLDLQLRGSYFGHLSRMRSGIWLLLGGVAAFVFAEVKLRKGQRQLPVLTLKPDNNEPSRASSAARWSVAAMGAIIGVGFLAAGIRFTTPLPASESGIYKSLGAESPAANAVAVNDFAPVEELRRNWPGFRGFEGRSCALGSNFASAWNTQDGSGIIWKTQVLSPGFSSPIVWGDKVFYSGGDAAAREVICVEGGSGKLLWRAAIVNPKPPAGPAEEVPESTGYAAASIATDGKRVYTVYANGDVGAVTMDGKLLWCRGFGPLKNAYGHSSSLVTWRDRLLLQLDQGDSEEGRSKLYALDGKTGQVAWERPRKVGASWASPVVFEAAGKTQVVVLSLPKAIAYDVSNGTPLWEVECLNGEVTPSPAFASGLVLVASPSDRLLAIKPDGQGDVTKTNVIWFNEDYVPDVTSPASNGELVFTVSTSGMMVCLDAKDGKKQWEHDFEMEVHSSPAIGGDKVYVFGQKGTAVVVEAARTFKEVFRTQVEDAFHASPAFGGDRIYVRGVTNLWCLGRK